MKKTLKRVIPFVLTLSLIFAFSAPVSAADAPTVISAPINPYVFVNDTLLTTIDARPTSGTDSAGNYTTMVPLRAAFESLGATVKYDGDTKLISAELGTVLFTFVSGTSTATVKDTSSGSGTEYIMDPAPVFSQNRTLIPADVFRSCFGLAVFDSFSAVYLTDIASIFSASDAKFTIFDKIMAASVIDRTLKQTGTFSGSVSFASSEDDLSVKVPFDGKLDSLSNGNNASGSFSLNSDFKDLIALLPQDDSTSSVIAPIIELLQNFKVDYIVNADESVMFLKSPVINLLMSQYGSVFNWLKLDLSQFGADLSSISETSFTGVLETMMYAMAETQPNGYSMANYIFTLMETMYADNCFTVSGTDSAPVYTVKWDKSVLEKVANSAFALTGEEITDDLQAEIDEMLAAVTLDGKMTFSFRQGYYATDVSLNMGFAYEGMNFEMKLTGKSEIPGSSDLDMSYSMNDEASGLSVGFSCKIAYSNALTDDKVPAGPSDNETVFDPFATE